MNELIGTLVVIAVGSIITVLFYLGCKIGPPIKNFITSFIKWHRFKIDKIFDDDYED